MKTKVKEAPISPKKGEHAQQKREFTKDELIEAVKNAFKGVASRIDPRYLWTDGGVHRFRVNCWSDGMIGHSEFVHVIEKTGKLTVRRNP